MRIALNLMSKLKITFSPKTQNAELFLFPPNFQSNHKNLLISN